jgi:hypothetical protein
MISDEPLPRSAEETLALRYQCDESGRLTWTEEGLRTYRSAFRPLRHPHRSRRDPRPTPNGAGTSPQRA